MNEEINNELLKETCIELIKDVFAYFNTNYIDRDTSRKGDKVRAKFISIHLLYNYTSLKISYVGSLLYHSKDHSNIITSTKRVNDLLDTDKKYKIDYDAIYESNKDRLLLINKLTVRSDKQKLTRKYKKQ